MSRVTDSVQFLAGVGPKRAELLAKFGVRTVWDALALRPARYEDRRHFQPVAMLHLGTSAVVAAKITGVWAAKTKANVPYVQAMLTDGAGTLRARWYRSMWLLKMLQVGQQIVVSGRLNAYPPVEFVNPEWEILEEGDAPENGHHTGRIVPIYPLTAGITQRWLRAWLADLAEAEVPAIVDPLPKALRERHSLPDLGEALRMLHRPETLEAPHAARRRLGFDAAFAFSLAIQRRRAARVEQVGIAFRVPGLLVDRALATLPFALTGSQHKALEAIWADMARPRPMQRLLQGDVGSGKTIIAFLAALTAIDNGYQAAIMAPTEILAAQHAERAKALCEPLGVLVVHLAGGMRSRERTGELQWLASGLPCLAIGTHALLSADVAFGLLGFVVVDEQHRFGVLQRASLQQKAAHPDVLVMTATPIPRSLALVLYGDLDLTVLDELPPGRIPVTTLWLHGTDRRRLLEVLEPRLQAGERAFIVCPLVSDEESPSDRRAAVQTAEAYARGMLGRFGVGLVHGRLSARDKQQAIADFRLGRIRILVATTVVEVGMDVPEATVMVIEHADRLGLAQLHQLRGRVGRGDRQGVCVVCAEPREISETARARLDALLAEPDGFALAEADLRLRGPGDVLGTRQAGLEGVPLQDLLADPGLLEAARAEAQAALQASPDLDGEWAGVRRMVEDLSTKSLARVG